MIIACPACATRYAVPDTAIGIDGRMVRCAKCKHAWFQEGAEAALPPVTPAPPTAPATPPEPVDQPAPAGGEGAPPPAPPPPLADAPPVRRVYSDQPGDRAPKERNLAPAPSSFAHEPPFRPRRNPARMRTMAAVIFALVMLAAIGGVAHYGLPAWVPVSRSAFAPNQPDLVLDFPPNRQDRRTLPDGTQFFGVSGSVTNVGKERHSVPAILIVLRDEHNRIVFTFEIMPPKRVLAPGESEPVIEAVTDIPRSAKFAEIGWKPS